MGAAAFRADRRLKVVVWAKDDVLLHLGVSPLILKRECLKHPRVMAWLGYHRAGGVPKFGGQLLGLPRGCVRHVKEHLDRAAAAAARESENGSAYLTSLDRWVRLLQDVSLGGYPLCVAAPHSMAGQRHHDLRGRR